MSKIAEPYSPSERHTRFNPSQEELRERTAAMPTARLPASAWRRGYRGSAWVLIGAGQPQQIDLIDPDRAQPVADWLRPAVEAPQSAKAAMLLQK